MILLKVQIQSICFHFCNKMQDKEYKEVNIKCNRLHLVFHSFFFFFLKCTPYSLEEHWTTKEIMGSSKYIYFSFNRVQKCSEINHMNPHNLALVFSSCLFQTKGQTSEEVSVIEDLIKNYVQLFDVGIFLWSILIALLLDMLIYSNILNVRDDPHVGYTV